MLIAFRVILMIIMVIAAMGTLGERKDDKLQKNMFGLFIASTAALLFSFLIFVR